MLIEDAIQALVRRVESEGFSAQGLPMHVGACWSEWWREHSHEYGWPPRVKERHPRLGVWVWSYPQQCGEVFFRWMSKRYIPDRFPAHLVASNSRIDTERWARDFARRVREKTKHLPDVPE
jgi:hypothetical protein